MVGDDDFVVTGLGALSSAQTTQLSHLSSVAYRDQLPTTQAGAVLLKAEDAATCPTNALVVENPYLAFAYASQLFVTPDNLSQGVHSTACVDDSAILGDNVSIGANVVVGANARIGRGVRIHPNTIVGQDCIIGDDCELRANVTLYSDVHLGARCVIHSGAVLGADGFGFTPDARGHLQAIAQLGGVRIGDDVSVGANTTIDRGAIDPTVIDEGVKIDNQVQIGHNCHIGAHTIICGMVGIVGSTTVGKHCVFAGGAGVGGDRPITICDHVVVSVVTTITSSIDKPGVYSGAVLHNTHSRWKRVALALRNLDEFTKRVRKLEKAVLGEQKTKGT